MTERELNGDETLGLYDRLRYVGGNLRRNLRPRRTPLEVSRWPAPDRLRGDAAPGACSPLRSLSEAFVREELPRQRPPGAVAVLAAAVLQIAGLRDDPVPPRGNSFRLSLERFFV